MSEIHLRVILPANRNHTGTLRVEIDGRPMREFPVLGRGSRGAGNTWFLENGNTPTGTYDGSEFAATATADAGKFGPWGKVVLKPIDGEALVAEQVFGRKLLRIHGGDLGRWFGATGSTQRDGNLRPTHGCLRLSNENMRILREILRTAWDDPTRLVCTKPQVLVTVSE